MPPAGPYNSLIVNAVPLAAEAEHEPIVGLAGQIDRPAPDRLAVRGNGHLVEQLHQQSRHGQLS